MTIIEIGNFFMSEDIGELTKACCAAVPEFGDVIKDAQNPFFRSTYADLANYIEATRAPLAKHGVFLFQGLGMIGDMPTVTTMLAHASNQILGFTFPMPASKPDAQGIGGAISYDRRYSYGPATNTAGEEDDDGNTAAQQRGEHLKKQEDQMAGQERISLVMAKTFLKTAADHGRTPEQIKQYLDELNGYVQAEDITKQHWEQAKMWALNAPKPDDLLSDLAPSLQQAQLKKIFALANKKKINYTPPNDDLHKLLEENFKKQSLKQLNQIEYERFIQILEDISPAG